LKSMYYKNIKEIDLLTLGSFFNDREISSDIRQSLFSRLGTMNGISRVLIESRAEYLTYEKLVLCKKILRKKTILEFGIGLESANDHIRNNIIKKNLSREDFEHVVSTVKMAGCDLLVYILIKPPSISEAQAINDAIDTAKYVHKVAEKYNIRARIAYEPVFVCENTPLEILFFNNEYHLANLWSVVEIVRRSHHLRSHHLRSIYVGLSDENLSLERVPSSCPKCYKHIINTIEFYNQTQNISLLEKLTCECKKDYMLKMQKDEL